MGAALTPRTLDRETHRAQMRLQLRFAGQVHAEIVRLHQAAQAALTEAAQADGTLGGLGLNLALSGLQQAWRAFMHEYQRLLDAGRREAVEIAFGRLPVLHNYYVPPGALTESRRTLTEQDTEPAAPDMVGVAGFAWFRPQVEAILTAGQERVFHQMRLSDRIWNLDTQSWMGIQSVVYEGVAGGNSAWNVAKKLEVYLGVAQNCPRWTEERLYGLTKTEIAQGDRAGLYSGDACFDQGVAYNALRLARTEIQYAHNAATQQVFARMPWVTEEQVTLSPAHPRADICDDVIAAAPDGDGVYPKGQISLPLHPNCLCYFQAVLMEKDIFTERMGEWVTGEFHWGAMDDYATWVGLHASGDTSLPRGLDAALRAWLGSDIDAHDQRLGQYGAALFPDDLMTNLEVVRSLGGSTGAQLVRDPRTGQLYVYKTGNSADQCRSEAWANLAYRAAGINVPDIRLYETSDGPVMVSKYIENTRTLREVLGSGDKRLIRSVLKQLQDGFTMDALLANWDVIGLDSDNILIDAAGVAWRVDNGGAFMFRAQGAHKRFDAYPTEFWSLRNAGINAQSAAIFGDLDWKTLVGQINSAYRSRQDVYDVLPEEARSLLAARYDEAWRLATINYRMARDKFRWSYLDAFSKATIDLRDGGLLDLFPENLTHDGVVAYDERRQQWDRLRGRGSSLQFLDEYMRRNGGDYSVLSNWMSAQSGSSWSGHSQAIKYMFARGVRDAEPSDFYWQYGLEDAKTHYELAIKKLGEDRLVTSWAQWHAFTHEFLQYTGFQHNQRGKNQIGLIRTEDPGVLSGYAVPHNARNTVMPRGPAESASLWKTVTVGGSIATRQYVPHHRVLGLYFFERTPGTGMSAFYGDRENEVIFVTDGIRFDAVGGTYSGEASTAIWYRR